MQGEEDTLPLCPFLAMSVPTSAFSYLAPLLIISS